MIHWQLTQRTASEPDLTRRPLPDETGLDSAAGLCRFKLAAAKGSFEVLSSVGFKLLGMADHNLKPEPASVETQLLQVSDSNKLRSNLQRCV